MILQVTESPLDQIGIGVGMGLLAIGGFFLSLFSFGTATPAVVEAEADLSLAEVSLETGATLGEETSSVVASAARQTLSDSFFKVTVATRTQAVSAPYLRRQVRTRFLGSVRRACSMTAGKAASSIVRVLRSSGHG